MEALRLHQRFKHAALVNLQHDRWVLGEAEILVILSSFGLHNSKI
jgi:hypothetical protein